MSSMATNMTLLCIHCDPAPLSLLRANGYRVLTATSGHEGLQLFMTRQVDAIVLEYHMGFLDGGVVAAEIKKTRRPQIPILMVVDHLDVPEGAFEICGYSGGQVRRGPLPGVGRPLCAGGDAALAGQNQKK